jgi:hypothetical protein
VPDSHRGSSEAGPDPTAELPEVSKDPAATGPIPVRSGNTAPLSPSQPTPLPVSPAPRPLPGSPVRRTGGGAVLAAAGATLVLIMSGLWAVSGPRVVPGKAGPATMVRTVAGTDLAEQASRTDTDCAAHSYGRVQRFLAATPCVWLRRTLYTGTSPGGSVVVSVSTVRMASEQNAVDLQKLTDTNGTGNISDLLREGVRVEGGPARLRDAGYASQRRGTVLVIVEADAGSGTSQSLRPLAEAALVLGG